MAFLLRCLDIAPEVSRFCPLPPLTCPSPCRQREVQRTQLQRDLDEQVQQKREREARMRADEQASRNKVGSIKVLLRLLGLPLWPLTRVIRIIVILSGQILQ